MLSRVVWTFLIWVGCRLDKDDIFLEPVSRTIAPDYFDIIKKPVDWLTIGNRIQKHHYLSVEAFKVGGNDLSVCACMCSQWPCLLLLQEDIRLVFANAVRYNKPDTVFNRAAQRLAVMAEPILAKLDNWTSAEKQAEQAILMALLTQDRINSLFDLGEDLSLFDEGDRPKMLQLDDVSGTPLLTPQDDRPRRAKNKKQRQAEQKAEHELQAKLEREAIEQVRREAEQTAREAEEAARLAEEQRRQAEVEEAKRQEEEAERLKAEKKAAQRERDRQAKQAKKEKERIAKEKKRESNRRRKEERRRAAESRAAGPSPPQPKQTEKRQTRGDAKGASRAFVFALVDWFIR